MQDFTTGGVRKTDVDISCLVPVTLKVPMCSEACFRRNALVWWFWYVGLGSLGSRFGSRPIWLVHVVGATAVVWWRVLCVGCCGLQASGFDCVGRRFVRLLGLVTGSQCMVVPKLL